MSTLPRDRVDSLTMEDDDSLILVEEKSCRKTCQSRPKSDLFQIVLIALLSFLALVITCASHSHGLLQLESIDPASGEMSCSAFGWFYRAACGESSREKKMLLELDADLGVAGVAFGVAHLVQTIAFVLLTISLAYYNPNRPIRCFRSSTALVSLTVLAFVATVDILFTLGLTSHPSLRFYKLTPLWALYASASNLVLIVVSVFVSCYTCVANRQSEFGHFEKIPGEAKIEPPQLSIENLEEFYGAVGHRSSISMSPPTHRRGSSGFTAILGLQTVRSPHDSAYTFQENSTSSGNCSSLLDELNELTDEQEEATPSVIDCVELESRPVETWSVQEVAHWAEDRFTDCEIIESLRMYRVDGKLLSRITDNELALLGIETDIIRQQLQKALSQVQGKDSQPSKPSTLEPSPTSSSRT